MNNGHYDVIIIGTGAGGGTLARKLAPSGKKILILERGDFVWRRTLGEGNAHDDAQTRRLRIRSVSSD